MYVFCYPKPLSINDLQRDKEIAANMRSPSDLRRLIPIAVIDDQPFAPEHNLKNNQFQINTFTDIHKIDQIQSFPIVLCDLQGVGLQLASDMQGAYLIEEIKRNYPEKAVIAFTGGATNSTISKRAAAAADDYLRKDASIEDWRELLDKHIKNLSDPVFVWKQLRLRLIQAEITPLELLKFEHAYVSSIKSGSHITKNAIQRASDSSSAHQTVKREIATFITSKAFDLVFEALKATAS
jgi:DNA-binding NarL/FixJ family response regulator